MKKIEIVKQKVKSNYKLVIGGAVGVVGTCYALKLKHANDYRWVSLEPKGENDLIIHCRNGSQTLVQNFNEKSRQK